MFQLCYAFRQAIDMGSQPHVVLEVFEVVTHQIGNDVILLSQLILQILITTLQGMELLLEGLDLTKLFGLHDHHIVCMVHPIFGLEGRISGHHQGSTVQPHHHLNIRHGVVQPSTHHSNQLTTSVDNLQPRPLVVMPVPLLRTAFYLCCIVGHQGQMLEMMMSGDQTRCDKVLERKTLEGSL